MHEKEVQESQKDRDISSGFTSFPFLYLVIVSISGSLSHRDGNQAVSKIMKEEKNNLFPNVKR